MTNHPYNAPQQQPIVVNMKREPRKPQSILIHLLLLVITGGIGNIVYFLYVHNWNAKRGL